MGVRDAMKTCSKCSELKDETAFSLEYGRRRAACKECRKAYLRGYYANNASYFEAYRKANAAAINKKSVACSQRSKHERYTAIQELKSKPCFACGGVFSACAMDFDHRDPSTKVEQISTMVKTYVPWPRILEEIAKCDLLCACCHRLKTYGGSNVYRTRLYARNYEMVTRFKETTPCLDCNRSFKACQMDFDHVRGVKSGTVSQMLGLDTSVLLAEIEKCDLVCANCHRIRTYTRPSQRASKKLVLLPDAKIRERARYVRAST
jgi:hypothetical protein